MFNKKKRKIRIFGEVKFNCILLVRQERQQNIHALLKQLIEATHLSKKTDVNMILKYKV